MQQRKLGRYELVRVLGMGAMGVVYEARDPNLDRRVAIKTIMVDDLAPDAAAEYEERFRTEARSAARLQHPNIVTVHDSDRDGNTAFLVMEFVEGDDLKRHLDRGDRHDVQQALHLITDLLAALDFAHRQGVVHRDVKPANLLIEPGGRLKLTDFGVARISGEATRTQGSMIGTLKYMAPEQVQGQKVDARADLFSAAVVAYQLLTGVRPFDGDNDFSIIQQVIGHTPSAPSSLKPGLPPAVDTVFARAMAKNRNERFQSGADFSAALQGALEGVVLPAGGATIPGMAPIRRVDTMPATTIPGTGIDQELELEYWRAVRDSTDRRELEGFLARFPGGLYADLARRRLHRLMSEVDPDETVLHGSARAPATTSSDPTRTEPMTRSGDGPRSTAEGATVPLATPAAVAPAEAAAIPADPPARKPRWMLAAVGALALASVAAVWVTHRQGGAAADAVQSAPQAQVPATAQPPVLASTPASPPPQAAASPSSVQRADDARSKAVVGATGRVAGAAGSKARTSASPSQPSQAAATQSAHATAREPSQEHGSGGLVPPSVTCRDKMFLARQFCVYNECQKPAYQNFPACVRLREEARLREGGKYGN
ncbi:MAG: serine/threonine-protein kinase [Ramlibacter sp.]